MHGKEYLDETQQCSSSQLLAINSSPSRLTLMNLKLLSQHFEVFFSREVSGPQKHVFFYSIICTMFYRVYTHQILKGKIKFFYRYAHRLGFRPSNFINILLFASFDGFTSNWMVYQRQHFNCARKLCSIIKYTLWISAQIQYNGSFQHFVDCGTYWKYLHRTVNHCKTFSWKNAAPNWLRLDCTVMKHICRMIFFP